MKYALIVAGGKGLRMGSELPKQFLPVGKGKAVLMYTLEAFYRYDSRLRIVLVLPREQQAYWKELCSEKSFTVPHEVVDGGDTRFHSVKNGLSAINGEGLIAVHDGVRPLVSQAVIAECFRLAETHRAVIPVLNMVESLRKVTADTSETVNRDSYRLVQTPQVFDLSLLRQAYSQEYNPLFTDDASVLEAMGEKVYLTVGNRENIKITTPFDLKVANALLS